MAKIPIDKDELKKKLSPEQYDILINHGNETPFTGELLHNNEKGDYLCPVCGSLLFKSDTKFESGFGWPSFYDVASNSAVELAEDNSYGMHRTEVNCATCGSHLGHVFDDAYDQPTGKRYCIASAALNFKPSSSAQNDK